MNPKTFVKNLLSVRLCYFSLMLHLYYVFYTFIFRSWYLLVYYAIFCPTLNNNLLVYYAIFCPTLNNNFNNNSNNNNITFF